MKTSAIAAVFLIACTASAQRVPDMKPGDTCEKLRATYGKESSQEGPAHVWQQDAVTIRVLVKPGGPCVAGLVEYSIQPGHKTTEFSRPCAGVGFKSASLQIKPHTQ